jgi:hypothetical protein
MPGSVGREKDDPPATLRPVRNSVVQLEQLRPIGSTQHSSTDPIFRNSDGEGRGRAETIR